MEGLRHLWFLTAIMICYLLLIVLKRIDYLEYWNTKTKTAIALTALFFLDVLCAYTIRMQLQYFIAYFIGYIIGKRKPNSTKQNYAIVTASMACAMITRVVSHKYFDGSIAYNDIIVSVTQIILALWIYATIQFISQNLPNIIQTLAQSKWMTWAESYSIYLYMTHYMFLTGPFYIGNFSNSKPLQLFFFFIGTLISAHALQYISEKTLRLLHY